MVSQYLKKKPKNTKIFEDESSHSRFPVLKPWQLVVFHSAAFICGISPLINNKNIAMFVFLLSFASKAKAKT